jgi:hypothetical protein
MYNMCDIIYSVGRGDTRREKQEEKQMASRAILSKAQVLKAKMEAAFPAAKLVIINRSKSGTIGRDYAIEHGLEIIEDTGALVTAIMTSFHVLEVKLCCGCGSEILTAAIGEAGNDECQDCRDKRGAEFKSELTGGVIVETERIAELEWRNNQEE